MSWRPPSKILDILIVEVKQEVFTKIFLVLPQELENGFCSILLIHSLQKNEGITCHC